MADWQIEELMSFLDAYPNTLLTPAAILALVKYHQTKETKA